MTTALKAMNSAWPRSGLSILRSILRGAALIAATLLAPVTFAQQVQPNSIPVKNWPVAKWTDRVLGDRSAPAAGSTSGLVYISITPCRGFDSRGLGGSGKTGLFGPPSLLGSQPRIVPVPASDCGVPVAAAYSMSFASVTPLGQAVGWIAAWQDDLSWPGTALLNAPPGRHRRQLGHRPGGRRRGNSGAVHR
jgi:hypothetical protein